MSAWDEAVDVSAHPELFFEDASENLRALQELVGEWQELRSVSTDTADDGSKVQSMERITQAANAHAIQVRCTYYFSENDTYISNCYANSNASSFRTVYCVRKPILSIVVRYRDKSLNK